MSQQAATSPDYSCLDCLAPLALSEDGKRRRRYCEDCRRKRRRAASSAAAKKRWATDPDFRERERVRLRRLAREIRANRSDLEHAYVIHSRVGLSVDDYMSLIKTQQGKCRICSQVNANGRRLAVDHDHTTGKVRGLLCHSCNTGLGHFRDSPELLLAAGIYLELATA